MSRKVSTLAILNSIKRKYIQAISKTAFPTFTEYEEAQFDAIETALRQYEKILTHFDIYAKVLNTENKLKAFEFLKNNLNIEFEIKDNKCFIILKFDGFYAQQELPKQEFDLLKETLK